MRRYGKNPDEDDIRVRPNSRGTRPRTTIRPKHEDAAEGMVLTVDRGRLHGAGRRPRGHRDEGARTGPQVRGRRRPGRGGRRPVGGQGHAGPDSQGRGAQVGAAADRGRRRPVRAGGRRQRRPAGHRHRARRPGTPPPDDRPLPGGGLRRRTRPAAGAHQVRPGTVEAAAGDLRHPRPGLRGHQPGGLPHRRGGPDPRAPRGPGHRLRRAQRRRQDDPGQRAGGTPADHRRGQRRDGARPATPPPRPWHFRCPATAPRARRAG